MAQSPKPRQRMTAQSKSNVEAAVKADLHGVRNGGITATVIGKSGKTANIVDGSGQPIVYKNSLTAKRSIQKHNPGIPIKLAPDI